MFVNNHYFLMYCAIFWADISPNISGHISNNMFNKLKNFYIFYNNKSSFVNNMDFMTYMESNCL